MVAEICMSPLYSLKTDLDVRTDNPTEEILGALSLSVWTLIIAAFVKYVILAMRMDNEAKPAFSH
jgi:K+ transporter